MVEDGKLSDRDLAQPTRNGWIHSRINRSLQSLHGTSGEIILVKVVGSPIPLLKVIWLCW